MSTEVERPWLDVELHPDTRRRSLTDEIVEIFEGLYLEDVEDVRKLSTSPDNEDSVTGNVTWDRVLLAAFVKKMATAAQPQVMEAKIKDIARNMNRATKRVGVDRVAIAQRKAETLAIQGSQAAVADEESESPNTRRPDEPAANGSPE